MVGAAGAVDGGGAAELRGDQHGRLRPERAEALLQRCQQAVELAQLGKVKEAELLSEDLRSCAVPVVGVLGNHDYERGWVEQVMEVLRHAGMRRLDGQATVVEDVTFVGVEGFAGGFGQGMLCSFGEPAIKAMVAESLAKAMRRRRYTIRNNSQATDISSHMPCRRRATLFNDGSPHCPVLPFAEQIAQADRLHHAADVAWLKAAGSDTGHRDAMTDMELRMEALKQAASYHRAQSYGGALFQIAMIHDDVDCLFHHGVDRSAVERRMRRNLHSVMGWLEARGGETLEERGLSSWMSRRRDPHLELQKRIDALAEKPSSATA